MKTLSVVVTALLVFAANIASADAPDADLSSLMLGPDLGMTTCPAGDGPVSQYITVTVRTPSASPIGRIPYNCFFFCVTGGDIRITPVDLETNAQGRIRFECFGEESIAAPGITLGMQIYTVVLNDTFDLDCKAFDLFEDSNGWLNLQDFIEFSGDYGLEVERRDYDWSGGPVGPQDFILFSAHYGHAEP